MTIPAINMLSGFVIDFCGTPAIVTHVARDTFSSTVTLGIDSPKFTQDIQLDYDSTVTVLGTAYDLTPETLVTFTD